MSVDHLEILDRDSTVAWRAERLGRTGLTAEVALRVAADPGYDLHELFELVDQGCPPALAVRIVAPLDEEQGP
jgi:hypothetical protein